MAQQFVGWNQTECISMTWDYSILKKKLAVLYNYVIKCKTNNNRQLKIWIQNSECRVDLQKLSVIINKMILCFMPISLNLKTHYDLCLCDLANNTGPDDVRYLFFKTVWLCAQVMFLLNNSVNVNWTAVESISQCLMLLGHRCLSNNIMSQFTCSVTLDGMFYAWNLIFQ